MVHCRANEKYLQLAMENRLRVDETILNRFRDAERMDVIRIMKLAGGYIQELYRRGSPSRPWKTKTRSGAAAQKNVMRDY